MNPSRPAGAGAGGESHTRATFPKSDGRGDGHAPLQPSLGDQISDATDKAAASVAASLTGDVKEAAKTAQRAVKQQASEFMGQVGHELSKTAEEQKYRGVDAIDSFAHAITTAAQELDAQSPLVAKYVRDAAEKI